MMRQFIIALATLLLITATVPAQQDTDYGLIQAKLIDMGFVVKRVEVTTVFEKPAVTEPKSTVIEVPVAPVDYPPLPPMPEKRIPLPDNTPTRDFDPQPEPYNPNPRPIPGPVDDRTDTRPRATPAPGMKWIQSKRTGTWLQADSDLCWFELDNGEIRGAAPGKTVIFSNKQQDYFQVDPAFTYWDTDAGIIPTQKQNKLVQGPVTGTYYEIPADSQMSENPVTYASSTVEYRRRPALLPWNRVVGVPATTYNNGIETQMSGPSSTSVSPYAAPAATENSAFGGWSGAYDNNMSGGCPSGGCPSGSCPSGSCPR